MVICGNTGLSLHVPLQGLWSGGLVLLQKCVVVEGHHSQVHAVDQHGCTAALGVHPHHGTMPVVQQPTLAWGRGVCGHTIRM